MHRILSRNPNTMTLVPNPIADRNLLAIDGPDSHQSRRHQPNLIFNSKAKSRLLTEILNERGSPK